MTALYTVFLYNIELSEHRIGIKFEKDPLAIGREN